MNKETMIGIIALFVLLGSLGLFGVRPSGLMADTDHLDTVKDRDMNRSLAVATFAGGCFWCMQPPFDSTKGVVETLVGYAGGTTPNPTYELISTGTTDYVESVQVRYDPKIVTFAQLLDVYWKNIDPTQGDGQFADRGPQYHTVIFYHNDEQKRLAEESKHALEAQAKFSNPIVTRIAPATDFYRAEEYHQDYYKKNQVHYNLYKVGSGRAGFIERTWKEH